MKNNIYTKLTAIQNELHVKKGRKNAFGKYQYRSAEDILEAVKPLCLKHGVSLTISEELVEFGSLGTIKSTATLTCSESGDKWTVSAFAGIEKAGGMALPQSFGSASSYAKKYSLGNLLLIDDTADSDATNTHGKTAVKPSRPNLDDLI